MQTQRRSSVRRAVQWGLGALLLLGCAWFSSAHAQASVLPLALPEPAPGAVQVVHIFYHSQADINALAGRLDVWTVDRQEHTVIAAVTAAELQALHAQGYWVWIDEAQTAALGTVQPAAALAGRINGYDCYRTVQQTYTDLAQLAMQHPNLARLEKIGSGWLAANNQPGGQDLYVLVLTNRAVAGPKPKFFLMAAIHARELTTGETAARFAEQLVAGYGTDADSTWLLDDTEIHILPFANPEGRRQVEQGSSFWRKNVDSADGCFSSSTYGVDLNRNSRFMWGQCEGSGCSSSNACSEVFRGRAAGSEPETQAIQNYLLGQYASRRGPLPTDAAPANTSGLLISLHSYGNWVLYPWGWRMTPAPNGDALRTLGRRFSYFLDYTACQAGEDGCLYMTDGATDDWSYGELGIASYTFEFGTTFQQSCSYYTDNILDQALAALRYAAKAARLPYTTPAGPEVVGAALSVSQVVAGQAVTLTAAVDSTRYGPSLSQYGEQPSRPIAAVRATVDAPSWLTPTVTLPLTATDGLFNAKAEVAVAAIDTTGWPVGGHLIFVESQDTGGQWGVPTAVCLQVLAPGETAGAVPAARCGYGEPPQHHIYFPAAWGRQ